MDGNKNQSQASQALLMILNNTKDMINMIKTLFNVTCENNELLKSSRNNNIQAAQQVRFTVKNMTDAQLKDLILQGLSFEFIYYLSNRKFSIDYIRQVAQKIK